MLRDLKHTDYALLAGLLVGGTASAACLLICWNYRGEGVTEVLGVTCVALLVGVVGGVLSALTAFPLGLIADGAHSAYALAREQRALRTRRATPQAGQLSDPDSGPEGALCEARERGTMDYPNRTTGASAATRANLGPAS